MGISARASRSRQHLDLVVVVRLAELLADRLQLLAQQELALTARHLLLDHRGDLLLDLVDLRLPRHDLEHAAHAIAHVEHLEDLLLGARLDAEVRGHRVRERASVVDVLERRARVAVLLRQDLAQPAARRLAEGGREGVGSRCHASASRGCARREPA
jgi:hypothetical protein